MDGKRSGSVSPPEGPHPKAARTIAGAVEHCNGKRSQSRSNGREETDGVQGSSENISKHGTSASRVCTASEIRKDVALLSCSEQDENESKLLNGFHETDSMSMAERSSNSMSESPAELGATVATEEPVVKDNNSAELNEFLDPFLSNNTETKPTRALCCDDAEQRTGKVNGRHVNRRPGSASSSTSSLSSSPSLPSLLSPTLARPNGMRNSLQPASKATRTCKLSGDVVASGVFSFCINAVDTSAGVVLSSCAVTISNDKRRDVAFGSVFLLLSIISAAMAQRILFCNYTHHQYV